MRKFTSATKYPLLGLTIMAALACNQTATTQATGQAAKATPTTKDAPANGGDAGGATTESNPEGNAGGGTVAPADPGGSQGTVGLTAGNQGEGDGIGDAGNVPVASGEATEGNLEFLGKKCVGKDVEIPQGSGMGLTKDTVMTKLAGKWSVGLLPDQEKCLQALRLGFDENSTAETIKASGMASDYQDFAILLTVARSSDGNKQALQEASDARNQLEKLPLQTMEISGNSVTVTEEDGGGFSGTLSLVGVSGDKATVTRSSDGQPSETVDIHFVNANLIYVTKGSGSKEGRAFVKAQ